MYGPRFLLLLSVAPFGGDFDWLQQSGIITCDGINSDKSALARGIGLWTVGQGQAAACLYVRPSHFWSAIKAQRMRNGNSICTTNMHVFVCVRLHACTVA